MSRHKCSVIIPTKNALPGLRRVIDKVLQQETGWSFEVIVIDSGSTDGTAAYLQSLPDVRLISIAPENFGHGRTRNQAIKSADAEFVALLTHDAEPRDEHWLANLVKAAELNENIAGVFGRHVAYPTASPFVKFELDYHFQVFLRQPAIVYKDLDPEKYKHDIGWRQFLHFYSDNNSLMRKSVWEEHPYPDVEFAEDQLWAREIIEAGYWKAYAHDAVVLHSHDYSISEQLRRAFDESRNFKKYFDYDLSAELLPALRSMLVTAIGPFRQKIDRSRYGHVTAFDRTRRAGQRVALVVGHFLGAHHDRIPKSWAAGLSLDNKLYKK